ncbi:hypothetical protein KR018_009159, partial [Drosophila ironensis]
AKMGLESLKRNLKSEMAATGNLGKSERPKGLLHIPKECSRTKGRLIMIFRLGENPSCIFKHGIPPPD